MGAITDGNLASRRELLFATAGGLALALARPARAAQDKPNVEAPMASAVPYTEHRISHDGHMIYARDYPGQDPAFVMMHGFPDNLHIYDYVVPYAGGAYGTLPSANAKIAVINWYTVGLYPMGVSPAAITVTALSGAASATEKATEEHPRP